MELDPRKSPVIELIPGTTWDGIVETNVMEWTC